MSSITAGEGVIPRHFDRSKLRVYCYFYEKLLRKMQYKKFPQMLLTN